MQDAPEDLDDGDQVDVTDVAVASAVESSNKQSKGFAMEQHTSTRNVTKKYLKEQLKRLGLPMTGTMAEMTA
eukprot:6907968-Karenia_brevis.AAC.1